MTHYLFECEKTKLRAIAVVKSMAWHMIRDEAKLRGLEPPTYQDIVKLKEVPNPHKKKECECLELGAPVCYSCGRGCL